MYRQFARFVVLLVLFVGALQTGTMVAEAAPGPGEIPLIGTVTAGGQPLSGATVTLYAGNSQGVSPLERTTTGSNGGFSITYAPPTLGVLYVATQGGTPAKGTIPVSSALRLLSIVGVRGDAGVSAQTLSTVTVNELTTVATTYALAQFQSPVGISGPSPGLENAAATTFNLVNPATGQAGAVVTDADNGSQNDTLATLNSVANLVALCTSPSGRGGCSQLLRSATPPGATTPTNTVIAVQNLVKNPTCRRANSSR